MTENTNNTKESTTSQDVSTSTAALIDLDNNDNNIIPHDTNDLLDARQETTNSSSLTKDVLLENLDINKGQDFSDNTSNKSVQLQDIDNDNSNNGTTQTSTSSLIENDSNNDNNNNRDSEDLINIEAATAEKNINESNTIIDNGIITAATEKEEKDEEEEEENEDEGEGEKEIEEEKNINNTIQINESNDMDNNNTIPFTSNTAAVTNEFESIEAINNDNVESETFDDTFNDFGQDNNNTENDFDDFGDFDDFEQTGNDDDDFGDFDDFEEPTEDITISPLKKIEVVQEPQVTIASQFVDLLHNDEADLSTFISDTLSDIWTPLNDEKEIVASPVSINGVMSPRESISPLEESNQNDGLLCTQCSFDLWEKLSRDSVFYNPITGSIGQFQWTRSETNRAYLNALGVRINYEDPTHDTRPTSLTSATAAQRYLKNNLNPSNITTTTSTSSSSSPSGASAKLNDRSSNHMRSNSLNNDISLASTSSMMAAIQNNNNKANVEEEPELDIDIAKAYCELTEETIRVFPDVKLTSMVVELTRLQRQAKEYLSYLLDQREQLMMDAETYNDLISCIVGHAQRLREQNVSKDASPAMVTKKKKNTGGLSGMIKRKNTTGSGSLGGGVLAVKSPPNGKSVNTGDGRRSM
ncbi:hypothetical protein BJ944DRAFT_64009 [Cunninghamella echinulata]|nr:hypothetical protein BJ944DRAFT_64009 [Cunninghamella echinulata]